MRVPNEFVHPLFFEGNEIIEEEPDVPFPMMMKQTYFYYDLIATNDSVWKPWEHSEQSIPAVLELWKEEETVLQQCFAKRDRKAAREPMRRALSYLMVCLFWLNGTRTKNVNHWEQEVSKLPLKPINCVERLQFVFERYDVYHSFVQLSELFAEVMKLFYKQIAMMKKGMSH
ncbi:YpoC family protein [Thermaerobacillus caldiproteolyticus]|uniref:YpoC family protein n=1 Tax=Thermaerobacillus caldiproteolyticus TaxID=247480 RepID=UPI0015EB80A4|nr:hypothetical protein [Anoxybacillus caldiproteolyticus]QPA32950.1 hypothetical protein ISX45_08805 [Anoxybacillus caldiproteolyticus]